MREAALARLGDVRATEIDAAEWQGGELQDLATPSLFGEARALMITDARSLTKDALGELGHYLESPDPDATLVICCQVAERGKVPAALQKLVKPVGTITQVAIARKELEPWLAGRARSSGVDLQVPGARALVETLGEEPGQLVAALQQLAGAYPGQKITPQIVAQQFRGLGEQKVWDLCDRAFSKDLPGAIRSLKSIEAGGDDPLKTLGGIASRIRDLIKVRALPDRSLTGAGREGSRAPVRLAGQALPAAGAELLDGPAAGPARAHHRRRSRAEVRRNRRRHHARADRRDRGMGREGRLLGADGVGGLDQAALAAGGRLLVDDALAGGLVQGAGCLGAEAVRRRRRRRRWRARTFFVEVFSEVRTALFRSFRIWFCLFRLIWDLMFAMSGESTSGSVASPGRPARCRPVPWRS